MMKNQRVGERGQELTDFRGKGIDSFVRALNKSPLSDILPSVNAPWMKFPMPRLDVPTLAPPLVRSSVAERKGAGCSASSYLSSSTFLMIMARNSYS